MWQQFVILLLLFCFGLQFHFKGESASFFVEGSRTAEALRSVSHHITVRDGSKVLYTQYT